MPRYQQISRHKRAERVRRHIWVSERRNQNASIKFFRQTAAKKSRNRGCRVLKARIPPRQRRREAQGIIFSPILSKQSGGIIIQNFNSGQRKSKQRFFFRTNSLEPCRMFRTAKKTASGLACKVSSTSNYHLICFPLSLSFNILWYTFQKNNRRNYRKTRNGSSSFPSKKI